MGYYSGEEEAIKSIIEDQIHVIPSAVRKMNYSGNNLYPNEGKIHLFTMVEFGIRKMFDVLYNYVRNEDNITLYRIGGVTYKKYYEECMKIKQKNIVYLGYIDEGTAADYMKYAYYFVFNTVNEGQGLPPMEAMLPNTQPVLNDLTVFRGIMGICHIITITKNHS